MDHHYIYMILIKLIYLKILKIPYQNSKILYSIKANPNKEIIKKFKNLKCEFEVSSIGEVKKF